MYYLILVSTLAGLFTLSYAFILEQDFIRAPLIRNEQAMTLLRRSVADNQLRKRDQLFNADGREYLIQVGVGTPPQYFNLTLDSGSSELWVPSNKCAKTVCPYQRFDPSQSSTITQTNEVFSIQYGLGNAEGVYAQDAVTVGTVTVAKQKIGLVNSTKDILGKVSNGGIQSNGIFGLGYPGLNSARGVQNDVPFAFNLMQQNQQLFMFSIYLTNSHQQQSQKLGLPQGEILFGGIDKTKFADELNYVPVIDYDIQTNNIVSPNVGQKNGSRQGGTYLYWTVPGQSVSTSKNYTYTAKDVDAYVLDTGTTMTYLPPSVVKGIVESVTAPKKPRFDAFNLVYRVDCGLHRNTQDTVNFYLSTSKVAKSERPISIAVPVSQLIIPIDTNDLATATSCMFAIAPADESDSLSSAPTWLLGEATLRAVYTVYDMGQNRVGLAPFALQGKETSNINPPSPAVVSAAGAVASPGNSQSPGKQELPSSNAASSMSASAIGLSGLTFVILFCVLL